MGRGHRLGEIDSRLEIRAATIALPSRDRGGTSTAVIKNGILQSTTTGVGSSARKIRATSKDIQKKGNNLVTKR